jgi:sterol desaturase/sphingolipid hydroxylase (fatty acid hydroxylase superfamily)
MSSRDLVVQVAAILFALAIVSGIELLVPVRAQRRSGARVRVNLVLTALVIGLNWLGSALVTLLVAASRAQNFGVLPLLRVPTWFQSLAGIVLLDFFTYLAHVAMHRVPILWRVHRVHHSDPCVDVTTSLRFHPFEALWRSLWTFIPALALGVPWQGFVAYRLISAITGLLEHANVAVQPGADRALSYLWVTPNMHKVHHSRAAHHAESNFGNILALYDRTFGTFTASERTSNIEYGLDTIAGDRVDAVRKALLLPFESSFRPAARVSRDGAART